MNISGQVLFRLVSKLAIMIALIMFAPSVALAATNEPISLVAIQDLSDHDGDGLPNYLDSDDDNDGVTDEDDYAPLDPNVWEAPPPPTAEPAPSPTPVPTAIPAPPTPTPVPPTAVPTEVPPTIEPTSEPGAPIQPTVAPDEPTPTPDSVETAPGAMPPEVPQAPESVPQVQQPAPAPVVASLPETGSGDSNPLQHPITIAAILSITVVFAVGTLGRRFGLRE